ncbi:MAG TPA: TonB-dependent receptor [Vicinamibacterales bacterium]|nr:TonB-dependent receptor [Vicinamibacterales bacterium]
MPSVVMFTLFFCLSFAPAAAFVPQAPVQIRIEVRSGERPVEGAAVTAGAQSATTDASGAAVLRLAPGTHRLAVASPKHVTREIETVVTAAADQIVRVELELLPSVEESVTVVATTRTGRRVEDQPTRVEILEREEVEEKMLMTPGDIVMMLNEMGGLRVQATSPSLGAASVRIHGMRGRYTRFLSDGLPLFGEQPGGLGLLQIPPMDLGRVEVVKGVSSALYGAGAMAGVVNLLSRRPGPEPATELLFNFTTRAGADTVLWTELPLADHWGLTLLSGGHFQHSADVDDDGWSDLASYERGVFRPRLVWDNGAGASMLATFGATFEEREGGTEDEAVLPATGAAYIESLRTRRVDAGVVAQRIVGSKYVLAGRATYMRQRHRHQFGEDLERDRHETAFGEITLRGSAPRQTWVVGVAAEHDRYTPEDLPQFGFSFTTPGVFAQDDIDLAPWLPVSGSARLDHHRRDGWFLSPQFSALARKGAWSGRVSIGTGFVSPTPLTEETEAAGLTRLTIDEPLEAERGRSVTADLTVDLGTISITTTVFYSHIDDAAVVDRDTYTLRNLDGYVSNAGLDLLTTYRRGPVALTGTYTFVRARQHEPGRTSDVALTPRHSAGFVAMIEAEDVGRLGLEVYVTGEQALEANPYRTTSEPYVIVGLLGERRFGRVSLFINGENLTGVRQSTWDPLLRPNRDVDGRWTVDAWAPLEGRVINGGMRLRF